MKLRGSYNQNEMNFTRKSNAKFILTVFKGQFWSFLARKNIKLMKFIVGTLLNTFDQKAKTKI